MLSWFQGPQDAYTLIARKNYSKAAKVLRQQLRKEPRSIHLRKLLADVYERSGDKAQAVAILDSLVDEFTDQGFAAKAIAVHKKIQRLDPERSDIDLDLDSLIEDRRKETAERPSPAVPEYETTDFVKVEDGFSQTPFPTSVLVADWFEKAGERQDFHWSPLLAGFSKDELAALIGGLRLLVKKPGAIVYGQGEPGQSMYILANGKARVYRRDKERHYEQVGVLQEGQFFGEASILTGGHRLSTITAASQCELLELDWETFHRISERFPKLRQVLQRLYDNGSSFETAGWR